MKIVAIGGGEIGRPGTKIETRAIDQEIIRLSHKTHPRLLFIPTASSDSDNYCSTVEKYFGKILKCRVDVLYLIKRKLTKKEIENKIFNSDIIYVGGGNTLSMLKVWRKYGVDKILAKALNHQIVLSGLSAGAICWFKYGISDSMKFSKSNIFHIRVKGLGIFPLTFCPHYNSEKNRKPSVKKMIQKSGGIILALENCAAIEIIDEKYRIITSNKKANAYLIYKSTGKIIEEKIVKDKKYRLFKELINKIIK
jgi:dipeptidase E